jgi:alcohol dehydrogenase class IV
VREHDTGARLSFFDPKTRAQGVFFDPVLALTAPVQLAVSASLTAFAAAVDGLQSSSVDPLAQALLTHALRLSSAWIPQMAAEPRSAAARLHVMTAALLAGQGSDFAGSGLGAAISHALGPRSGTANGVVEAILLPHTIRFNAPVTDGRLTDIAALFGTAADAERVADAVQQLLADIGCPQQLRDIGVSPEILDDVAEQAADDWFASQVPRPASRVQLLELLITAW